MSEIEPTPEMTRREKLAARRYNELAKFLASILNSLALAILGLGLLRAIFDPNATWPSGSTIAFAVLAPLALELVAIYLIRTIRLES